ncbi:MAG: biopolymer transporter ExbD [Candidatus Gastranaerophilales bacterium]|nr:biopolymer transporter ExbD [Candidatus Gastranaerophilales bacterium]
MARQRDSFNEINITPLTDIFLVLLIIMMVIAPLLDQQGLNLAVPEMVEAESVKDAHMINVTVDNQNHYFIDDREVSASQLQDTIANKKAENPDGVLIQTEPDSTHGAVVKVMDSARNAGVTEISVTEI